MESDPVIQGLRAIRRIAREIEGRVEAPDDRVRIAPVGPPPARPDPALETESVSNGQDDVRAARGYPQRRPNPHWVIPRPPAIPEHLPDGIEWIDHNGKAWINSSGLIRGGEITDVHLHTSGGFSERQIAHLRNVDIVSRVDHAPIQSDNETPHPVPPGDWTGPDAGGVGGLLILDGCEIRGSEYAQDHGYNLSNPYTEPNGDVEGKAPYKNAMQTEAPLSLYARDCKVGYAQEHSLPYGEFLQSGYLERVLMYPVGGTHIQVTSRRGRAEDPGATEDPYHFGNKLYRPAGMGGPFVMDDCRLIDEELWSREASAVTFANGYQGAIYIQDTIIEGSRGAFVCWDDRHKGFYYDVDRGLSDRPKWYLAGIGMTFPADAILYPKVYFDGVDIDYKGLPTGLHRDAIKLGGVGRVDFGRVTSYGNVKRDVMFNDPGSWPLKVHVARFHEKETLMNLSIATYDGNKPVDWTQGDKEQVWRMGGIIEPAEVLKWH